MFKIKRNRKFLKYSNSDCIALYCLVLSFVVLCCVMLSFEENRGLNNNTHKVVQEVTATTSAKISELL